MDVIRNTVRFTEDELHIHKALIETAKNNRRSLNSEMIHAFEFYLKNAPEAHYRVEKPGEKTEES